VFVSGSQVVSKLPVLNTANHFTFGASDYTTLDISLFSRVPKSPPARFMSPFPRRPVLITGLEHRSSFHTNVSQVRNMFLIQEGTFPFHPSNWIYYLYSVRFIPLTLLLHRNPIRMENGPANHSLSQSSQK
jgi:hypothetical protein